MTNRVSPFAALTGAEKQIKWLEYQSVRLPYIQSGMEDVPDTPATAPQSNPATSLQSVSRPSPSGRNRRPARRFLSRPLKFRAVLCLSAATFSEPVIANTMR